MASRADYSKSGVLKQLIEHLLGSRQLGSPGTETVSVLIGA